MVAHATPARRVDENVVRGDGPKVLTQTDGCGSEDELTGLPSSRLADTATVRRGRSAAVRKAGKVCKPRRAKTSKRTVAKRTKSSAKAKLKRAGVSRVARKKIQPMKPPSTPAVESIIVNVVEEPVPGVITVTEFEETEVREARANPERPDGN
jgi:hypothetical protein